MSKIRRFAASLSGGALIAFAVASGPAAQGTSMQVHQDGPPSLMTLEGADPMLEKLEKLEKPIVPEDVSAWADAVQRQFDGHPQFHAVGIDDSRTEATIWWHGERTTELDVAAATPLSAAVEVESTPFSPAELQHAVDRVFADPSLSVVHTSIRPNGSGIDVSTDQPQSRIVDQQADIEELAGVPVAITNEGIEPFQNRQDDRYLIGGARWGGFQDGSYVGACTTGFSIANRTTGAKGLVTAAHCGAVGSQWGPQVGNTVYSVGPMTSRQTNIDTAIVEVPTSIPGAAAYIYTGPYNSGTVTAINGNRNVMINTEICYSGSYTGLVCGNFVKSKSDEWGFGDEGGGDLTNVTGMRTERNNSTPAAGNGDSGGPGYALTVENGEIRRYAASIISGGPNPQFGGCPGLQADRYCGPTVYAGETWRFAIQTDWSIKTL